MNQLKFPLKTDYMSSRGFVLTKELCPCILIVRRKYKSYSSKI